MIVRESTIWKLNAECIRPGKLALMTPVMTFVEGRWVARIMCMPTARAFNCYTGDRSFDFFACGHYEVGKLIDYHQCEEKTIAFVRVEMAMDELCRYTP